jgi:hypothetical protein
LSQNIIFLKQVCLSLNIHQLKETLDFSFLAEILMPSDIQYGLDVSNRRVLFDSDEIKAIKKFGDPGFELLGFKSLSCLSPHHYVKPGHFIYPDEKYVEGSSCLFNALLKKCLEKKMFILCQFSARRNTPPRLGKNNKIFAMFSHYFFFFSCINTTS